MKNLSGNSHTVIFNQLLYAGMNPGEYFPTASIYNVFFNICGYKNSRFSTNQYGLCFQRQ